MIKNLMIIAGEASGDLHGSALVKSLLLADPQLSISGIGGDKMIAEGMVNQFHIKDMAFLGLVEVLKHLPFIKKVQTVLLNKIKSDNIKTVVLIDYPGFNLNFAKKIKKLGIKVIYYISPQIWAWHQSRIKKIKRLVDKMIVILPFEKDFYKKGNVDVEYFGHPLVERIDKYNFHTKEELYKDLELDHSKEILLLMPGSRLHEIEKIFPTIIKAAKTIASNFNMNIVVMCPTNIDAALFTKLEKNVKYKVATKNSYDLLKYSRFGIIKSGTSTLEAGLFSLPMIVVYSASAITYYLAKMLVKIKNIALINIVAGKTIVDELIQNDVNENLIVECCSEILNNNEKYSMIKVELDKVKTKLGSAETSKKVAQLVLAHINNA